MKHYFKYAILVAVTMFLGLQSRNPDINLPEFIVDHAGDALWTLMAYWGIRLLTPNKKPLFAFLVALSFSFFIELTQLYQADWANELRKNRIMALIFGSGFLWIDLVRYAAGALLGLGLDTYLLDRRNRTN
ncbi:MAG: DUF2809 domain-containing protein [Bacteroidia bacterium]